MLTLQLCKIIKQILMQHHTHHQVWRKREGVLSRPSAAKRLCPPASCACWTAWMHAAVMPPRCRLQRPSAPPCCCCSCALFCCCRDFHCCCCSSAAFSSRFPAGSRHTLVISDLLIQIQVLCRKGGQCCCCCSATDQHFLMDLCRS